MWYVRSTPTHKRKYCATRLLGRLTGPARLLAMSWTDLNFDHAGGTKELLQRLASSPLVRQSLPNAAAICQQYFSFQRRPNENIQGFLVRESLGYTEFVEALMRLHEDKLGIKQEEKDFGLPNEDAEDDYEGNGCWEWYSWEDDGASPQSRHSRFGLSAVEYPGDDQEQRDQPEHSPFGRRVGTPSRHSVGVQPSQAAGASGLSFTDSFVLGVLRGFRLLQAAGLSAEDKRDIIGATRGSLEFEVIARALQTLWDEQFLGKQASGSMHVNTAEHEMGDSSWACTSEQAWDWSDWGNEAYDGNYAADDWQDWHEAQPALEEETPAEDDPLLKEAQQAERVAESLAAEAQRSWSDAQKATAKRDRGFGHVVGAGGKAPPNKGYSGKGGGFGGCFICGGPHPARACPDQRHPSMFKGSGKGKSHYFHEYNTTPEELYYMGKGKGKRSGRQAMFVQRGKQGKGRFGGPPTRPPVNAYSADASPWMQEMFLGGLEIADSLQVDSAVPTVKTMQNHQGLIDCGATASAGPQVAVESLLTAVMSKDKQAKIVIQKEARPFFRFGNGRWGRALFQVTVESRASGEVRKFKLFALPNPPDLYHPEFDKSTLVPILVGMDHLSGSKSSMAIDFLTGLAMDSFKKHPEVYRLPSNQKGHYILDIVNYITGGNEILEGHATIRVLADDHAAVSDLHTLEFHPLEYYDNSVVDHDVPSEVFQHSRHVLEQLHVASQRLRASREIFQASMHPVVEATPNSNSCGNGSLVEDSSSGHGIHPGQHQAGNAGKEESSTIRRVSFLQDGHERSTSQPRSMAVLRKALSGNCEDESSRQVAAVCGVQSSPDVHPSKGKLWSAHEAGQPRSNHEDAGGAFSPLGRPLAQRGDLSCNASQTGCRGDLAGDDPTRAQDADHGIPHFHGARCEADQGLQARSQSGSFVGCGFDNSGISPKGSKQFLARHGPLPLGGGEGPVDQLDAGKKQDRADKPERGRGGGVKADMGKTSTPLPHRVAAQVMLMAAAMTSAMSTAAMDLCGDGRDCVWEIACAPHSWLSEAVQKEGMKPRRINLASGYDLYQPSTWEAMEVLRKKVRPRKLWFSLPCTKFCRWTYINYNTPERKEILRSHQRRERKMLWCMNRFLKNALEDDEEILVYFEWTHPCRGWQEPPMEDLAKHLQEAQVPWLDCRVDGCVYGMKDSTETHFIRKQWLIKTTDEHFWKTFRLKVCGGGHAHAWIQGVETARTSYYPWRLCKSIARCWRKQMLSDINVNWMFKKYDKPQVMEEILAVEEEISPPAALTSDEAVPAAPEQVQVARPPDPQARNLWQAKLSKFHKAAGHPTNANLARLLHDAGQDEWKVQMAREFSCPACESLRPGGTSSKAIPPAATHPCFKAWQAVGMDTAEWEVPERNLKVRFLLMIDLATKLRVVHPIKEYASLAMEPEKAEHIIEGFTHKWLAHFPKPEMVVIDNAKSFTSEQLMNFLSDVNVMSYFPPEKEPWAHGVVEAAVQDVKHCASAIQLESLHQTPQISLVLATSALNSTEYTAGYSATQWAFGRTFSISDEDARTFQQIDTDSDYVSLVQARQKAEEVAVRTRAKRALSKLSNTIVRQPLRSYEPMELVKIWRKLQPDYVHKGARGGLKMAGRPRWIGPGRVIFQETLAHQQEGDHRRHILWVLVGRKLFRCSVHSVRPVTATERFQHEIAGDEDPSKWKTLADILPKREYMDIVDEVPDEAEVELPDLPEAPDSSTYVPVRRAKFKQTFGPDDYVRVHRSSPIGMSSSSSSARVRHFVPPNPADVVAEEFPYSPDDLPLDAERPGPVAAPETVNDYEEPTSPASKKPRRELGSNWIEMMKMDVENEMNPHQIYEALLETDECLTINFEVSLDSNRQKKQFLRNPVSFMVKKINSAEVNLQRLTEAERKLFVRAKVKEVNSFIKNAAVRACLSDEETKEAYTTGRILKARWVLTWKSVPPDERQEALSDARNNPDTTVDQAGMRKAKARIVLLGFQHPSLLDRGFKTAAPVQSTIGRNLLYLLSVQHQWPLQGLDLATAFLQTQPTDADARIWTSGVEELRQALGVDQHAVLRILKNVYGSNTAPRGLWLDLHKTLTGLGAVVARNERCMWLWFSKTSLDSTGRYPLLLGAMGGHVDDFHRVGDVNNPEWAAICEKIDRAYAWGTIKSKNYRHAGTDIATVPEADGSFSIEIDQASYVETLMDLDLPPDRLREEGMLNSREIASCRTALGALQWLAIQTQPQLTARCNLLLTEITTKGSLEHAREIQAMIGEVRQESFKLRFFKLTDAVHWSDLVFVTMGDQAHNNRPKGDSTGGLISLVAGPTAVHGAVSPMMVIAWRSWKLKRKAIASNDAEIQAALEAEDQNYRIRLLWTEMHGASLQHGNPRQDLVEACEKQTRLLKGIVCTDSRGGYDAVELNESPLLGLTNMRAALQALQLRENMFRSGCELRWLASDYDLGDALTKRRAQCREGLIKYLRTFLWSIAFDPEFIAAKKNRKMGKTAIGKIDEAMDGMKAVDIWLSSLFLQGSCEQDDFYMKALTSAMADFPFWGGATCDSFAMQMNHEHESLPCCRPAL